MKRILVILISALVLIGGIAGTLNAFAYDNGLMNENLQALMDDGEPSWRADCYMTVTTTDDFMDSVRFCANCQVITRAKGVDYGGKGKCIPTTTPDIQ